MKEEVMQKRRVHIVTYTHWDREFRWEFERTRMRLVDCIDHLLQIMKKKPDYRSFLMDGQLTLIEDYLEIRPEKKDEIIELVREGRMEIGPWYTLADCAPIQGESVVRNILYGMRKSVEYGDVLKCGYNVFSFGQIGQLPQIYANFGIDTILFYKYMDPKRSKYHEFIWEAPDGTKALASRLGKEARWNFFFAGHIPIVYDKDAWDKSWQYQWGELGKVFHTAGPDGNEWFYEILDPETSFHKENIRKGMERALKTVEGSAAPNVSLMFEGTDFTEPHPLTTEIIAEIQKQYHDEIEIIHSTLTDYLKELKVKLKEKKDLDVVKGPMRDGPVGSIHTDVFSIHPEIMIENSHVENKILRYAEPLSTIAWKYGLEQYPSTYLEKIWKLMFQSHAHDSMHGLGPKTLGEGEVARLKQASVIAQGLERRGLQNITKEINTEKIKDTQYFLAVHNPSSFERSEVVEVYIDVPAEVRLHYLMIEDMEGNQVQLQELSRKETRAGVYHPRSRNMPFYCTKVHAYFMAKDIPAIGYKTYKVKWAQKKEYPYPHEDWDAPRIFAENMLAGVNQAENEYIRVKVETDGTVTITDKDTGKIYYGLNYFMDQGDKGNMWMYDCPANDRIINSIGTSAKVSVTTNGPLAVSIEVSLKLSLPQDYDFLNQSRSAIDKELLVKVEYLLKKGCRYLEVKTDINNTVKDHHFKVCFPTGLKAEKTWAEGSFAVTEYPILPSVNGELRGDELARHPAQLWYDVSDGKQGLAVLTDATKDYEILEHNYDQTMAMGLVRGVRLRIPCDNRLWMEYPGDESSQSIGEFSYSYALMPHTGIWNQAGLYEQALSFNAPMQVCQFGNQNGVFPLEKSFVSLAGKNLVLSSIKKSEDRETIIIRLYNPSEEDTTGELSIGFDLSEAYLINMNEERLKPLMVSSGIINFKAGHGKVISIELVM
jgi:mannosylglycerate hydrolase